MRGAALATLLAILIVAGGCKEVPPPESAVCTGVPQIALRGPVTDAAGILNAEEKQRLSQRLVHYEQRTTHQMVVATASTLNGATPMEFATCLGRRWGIGDAERNDGILILVAPGDRQTAISVGYGMEKALPDEKAKAVIERMIPHFKDGAYAGGLSTGIDAIAAQTGETQ